MPLSTEAENLLITCRVGNDPQSTLGLGYMTLLDIAHLTFNSVYRKIG